MSDLCNSRVRRTGSSSSASSEGATDLHPALIKSLRQFKQLIHLHQARERAAFVDELIHLRNLLGEHFANEQGPEYIAGLLEQRPELAHQAEMLRDEHQPLAETLEELIEDGLSSDRSLDELRRRALEWVSLVQFHESRENALLQDAADLDLGAED